jgi:hypothetical protein
VQVRAHFDPSLRRAIPAPRAPTSTSRPHLDAIALARPQRLLFAPDPITVSIKAVDVIADDSYGTGHILRTVPATARTVDIASDRDAGTRVIGVAVRALRLR